MIEIKIRLFLKNFVNSNKVIHFKFLWLKFIKSEFFHLLHEKLGKIEFKNFFYVSLFPKCCILKVYFDVRSLNQPLPTMRPYLLQIVPLMWWAGMRRRAGFHFEITLHKISITFFSSQEKIKKFYARQLSLLKFITTHKLFKHFTLNSFFWWKNRELC